MNMIEHDILYIIWYCHFNLYSHIINSVHVLNCKFVTLSI